MIATQQEKTLTSKIIEKFKATFNTEPVVIRSPGRVNIIGEHTDYNNGFVLPAAIDKAIYIAMTPRNDDVIRLYSGEFNEAFATTVAEMKPSDKIWPNYILGVADQVKKQGYPIR